MLSGEPRSPEDLLAELREAQNNGLLTGETFAMIEGAIRVTEMVVGDVMVPRAQMVTLDIDDEHDEAVPPQLIVAQPDGSWLVDALTPIEDFNEQFGTAFSDEEYDTVGGLVTAEIGHLPDPGETATLGDYAFDVTRADDRRVLQFRVRKNAAA